jgi:hypothetical protein
MRLLSRSLFLMVLGGLAAADLVRAANIEPGHAKNDIYVSLLRDGVTLAGTKVVFPEPLLHDGDSPAAEQAALKKLANSANHDLEDLIKKSDLADFISKPSDEKAADNAMIRHGNVWFVVYADLDAFDPSKRTVRKDDGKPVSAANMSFTTKLIGDDELKARKIHRSDPKLEWFTHLTGDLLEKVHVESTDRMRASRSEASWVFASRTDPRFDDDPQFPNRWWMMDPNTGKMVGKPHRYSGAASTTKISRLASVPGALLVESHFAFVEPTEWFDGSAVLRSKITLVAQDQIRRLRRELKANPQP